MRFDGDKHLRLCLPLPKSLDGRQAVFADLPSVFAVHHAVFATVAAAFAPPLPHFEPVAWTMQAWRRVVHSFRCRAPIDPIQAANDPSLPVRFADDFAALLFVYVPPGTTP